MSGLSALNLVYSKPVPKSNTREIRRQKLCKKLLQQLEMARCIKAGGSYVAVISKRIRDDETGEFKEIQQPKKIPDGHLNSPTYGHLKLPHLN